ncbi:MAG: SLC13 family permease, partial [Halobacteriota archaeon]
FVTEPIPLDVTAIAIMVSLIALEPWTAVGLADGLTGFSSPATITVLAMFVLSDGIRRTGVINLIGREIAARFGSSPRMQLASVLGLAGGSAGFINNTPVVAVMIPLVNELSRRTGISPSRLLMPVSFAAMMGGTLTLIGTSTNLLASDVYDRMGAEFEAFSMFEFTQLGIVVLFVGIVYLMTVGQRLVPERLSPADDLTRTYEMAEYLTEVVVREGSAFVDRTVREDIESLGIDVDVIQLIRDDMAVPGPVMNQRVRAGDIFVLRTDRESLLSLIEDEGLDLAPDADEVTEERLRHVPESDERDLELLEVVIAPESPLVGETLESSHFRDRYHATVLAIRRGGRLIHARMAERRLRAGDTLLIQGDEHTVDRFIRSHFFIVVGEFQVPDYRREKLPIALGIIALVVALPGMGLVPIVHSALAGMVAMVVTGCLRPGEIYESIDWSVIFILAGLIPLGLAMERTGAAAYIARILVDLSGGLEPVVVLALLYLVTALITEAVSNNASVILMIPIAVDFAASIGASPFSFALAVTFAASTAFMTPVGYQTNLMVYAPGGYRFTDFARVGIPLQLLLAVVTALGIAHFWGV